MLTRAARVADGADVYDFRRDKLQVRYSLPLTALALRRHLRDADCEHGSPAGDGKEVHHAHQLQHRSRR
jgi:hypothetical protein